MKLTIFHLGDNCELNMLREKILNTLYERNKVEILISITLNAILLNLKIN